MKYSTAVVFVLFLFWITACGTGSGSIQTLAQQTSPATRTDHVRATTPAGAVNTAPAHSPILTPTQLSTPLLAVSQTPGGTLTPTSSVTAPIPSSTHEPYHNRLLPDLQTLPPSDLRLLYNADTGRGIIRFTNSIWNSGPGKLELTGVESHADDRILVSQRIYAAASGFDEVEVGQFIFSGDHLHWHLEKFASYQVWSVGKDDSLESLVSSGEKVSWCILDEVLAETTKSGELTSTRPIYFSCEGEIQGLSVGWIDIYESYLPRQWVEISPLKDGLYALVSIANPDRILVEADYDNNTGLIYFEIRNLRLEIIGSHLNKQEDGNLPKSDLNP